MSGLRRLYCFVFGHYWDYGFDDHGAWRDCLWCDRFETLPPYSGSKDSPA